MYLHIGNNKTLPIAGIVGIFDLDSSSVSAVTKNYLRKREKEMRTEYATDELPKSFILTVDGRVHFSQISSTSLLGRIYRQ